MTDVPLLNALLFAALGIVVYTVALAVMVKLPPFDLWKQIVTERNVAAGIVAGAVALGLAWIIEPIIRKLPKESLISTLKATREGLQTK